MATKSQYVTDDDIQKMLQHIEDLQAAKKEIVLAENAGIKLAYTSKDLDDQISSLQTIIRTYQMK